jgi:hypothetical protein
MKIGVCGIACEVCPKMTDCTCPRPETGCYPKENPFCAIATCAHRRGAGEGRILQAHRRERLIRPCVSGEIPEISQYFCFSGITPRTPPRGSGTSPS